MHQFTRREHVNMAGMLLRSTLSSRVFAMALTDVPSGLVLHTCSCRYVLLGENAMGSEVTGSHGQFANHMQKRQWLNGLHAFHGCSGRRPASPVQRCAQLHSMTNISRLLAQQQCRGGGRDEKASLCKNHFVVDGTSTNGTALQLSLIHI